MSGKLQTHSVVLASHPQPQMTEAVPLQPWDSQGSVEGQARGAAPKRPALVWQLDWAAWQEPNQTLRQECASCSPGMAGTWPPSVPQKELKLLLWALFPAARHSPHLPRRGPKMCSFVLSFKTSMPRACCEPGTRRGPHAQEQGTDLPSWS